jgi:hypothetical protein
LKNQPFSIGFDPIAGGIFSEDKGIVELIGEITLFGKDVADKFGGLCVNFENTIVINKCLQKDKRRSSKTEQSLKAGDQGAIVKV